MYVCIRDGGLTHEFGGDRIETPPSPPNHSTKAAQIIYYRFSMGIKYTQRKWPAQQTQIGFNDFFYFKFSLFRLQFIHLFVVSFNTRTAHRRGERERERDRRSSKHLSLIHEIRNCTPTVVSRKTAAVASSPRITAIYMLFDE